MLIISWNVAGLSTTLQRINRDYTSESSQCSSTKTPTPSCSTSSSSSNTSNSSKKPTSLTQAFSHFLHRHGNPDILCIQEHKIPLSQLSSRSEPYNCTSIPGYESFWSCNRSTTSGKKGFNGVVTYVKNGLTTSATNTPFDNEELDCQGRCVMTDHGSFVVFNVYVPAGGANPLSYKMKFLKELRRCMKVQREMMGKKVFLVGDLNICHGGYDRHWKYRSIHVDGIVDEIKQLNDHNAMKKDQEFDHSTTDTTTSTSTMETKCVPKWKLDIYQHWDTIQTALSTIKVIPVTTKNMSTGSTSNKFRAQVTLNNSSNNNKNVSLGKAESTEEECLHNFTFHEQTYYDTDLEKDVIARKENVVPLTILYELMSKIAKVDWGTSVLSMIANTEYALRNNSPHAKWLSGLIDEDDMIDAFRLLYPSAQGRFTCWEQRTNNRFENIGVRLDYTIIDKSIAKYIHSDNRKLRCCNYPSNKDFNSDEAALHAATASGQFEGASFDGGGIVESSHTALDSQFGEPHTGVIYTPPSYSDHVAISLLLDDDWDKQCSSTLELDSKCSKTKKTQPHKAQKSISSFFGRASSMSSSSKSCNSANPKSVKSESKVANMNNARNGKNSAKRKSSDRLNSSLQKKKGTIHSFFKK